jgi:pyruvate dehydrogenase E1 component alpha subunit
VNDPGAYMPQDVLAEWKTRDPIIVLRQYLADAKVNPVEVEAIEAKVDSLIAEAVKFAVESPEPSAEEFLKEIIAL